MDKYTIYLNALVNALHECKDDETILPVKVIFYGVKTINSKPKATDHKVVETDYRLASSIIEFMGQLTPTQFMNIFPIEKRYDGLKTEMKDYFYTMDYIKSLDREKPIGEGIIDFLWEYTNREIARFNVKVMGYISDLKRHEGYLDPLEEYMAAKGMKTPNTFKDSKGRSMYVRNGKPVRVEPVKSERRFKVVE